MEANYTCECRDGRVIMGTARWLPGEVNQMDASELLQMLSDMVDFARYYNSEYRNPRRCLEEQGEKERKKYTRARRVFFAFGLLTSLFAAVFFALASQEAMRNSVVTLGFAGLTVLSFLVFFLLMIRFFILSFGYRKRFLCNIEALDKLQEREHSEMSGSYLDDLISGFVALPDYYLSESALQYMIYALMNHRVSSMREAVAAYEQTCKQDQKCAFPPEALPIVAGRLLSSSVSNPSPASKAYSLNDDEKNLLTLYRCMAAEQQAAVNRFLADFFPEER